VKITFFYERMNLGGIQRFILHFSKWLVERNIKVELVLARAIGEFLSQIPIEVKIVDLSAKPLLLTQNYRLGYMLPSIPKLVKYLRNCPTDVLLSFEITNFVALWARWLAGSKIPVIISEHSHPTTHAQGSNNRLERLVPFLKRLFYRYADVIVAVSQGVADDLARITKIPRSQIHVIYNPVAPDILQKANEPLDHPWFSDGQPPVILGVGRLNVQKDFPTLIKAFSLVRKKRQARLMILGEGEDRPKLERLVQELGLEKEVALPGFGPNPFKFMRHAALFVLSSRWEGLPYALIEALFCGCPVVATDCPGGVAEVLEGGRWGKLVPVGDAEAMAEAIIEVLDNPPDRKALQQRGLDFHIDRIGEQYVELIEATIKRKAYCD